jgi:hypothetical protein
MKNIFINLCTLLCVFTIVSCNDDDNKRVAKKGILDGENFGLYLSKISVYFNNKKAAVVGSTGRCQICEGKRFKIKIL